MVFVLAVCGELVGAVRRMLRVWVEDAIYF